jgi:hypothetical protein
MTKEGRSDLRYVMVEGAWTAVEHHPYWKAEFARLARRMDENKAIVAIARRLLVAVWHVLTKRAADVHADAHMVGLKFFAWSWKLTAEQHHGLSRRQFVRYHLLRLGLGKDLTHIVRGGAKRPLAPVDEVLQLRPEIQVKA